MSGYLGLFLQSDAVEELWEPLTGIPLLPMVHAHHMTLKFNPSEEEVAKFPFGVTTMLTIIGYGASDENQAFLVQPVPGFVCQNPYPHITIAISPEGKAKNSNELDWKKLETGLILPAISGICHRGMTKTRRP